MAIRHAKTSTQPDGVDPDLVQKTDWNDVHTGTNPHAHADADSGGVLTGFATDTELATHIADSDAHTASAHPNLADHNTLGLATQAELDAHAATEHGVSHPDLTTHDTMGLATDDAVDAAIGAHSHLGVVTGSFELVIDGGGGSAITTGVKYDLLVPFDCTITGWTLLADDTGDIVIDVWSDIYGNYPPTDADSITDGHEPELSGAEKAQDTDLSDWAEVALTAGETLRFNVDSVSGLSRVVLAINYERFVAGAGGEITGAVIHDTDAHSSLGLATDAELSAAISAHEATPHGETLDFGEDGDIVAVAFGDTAAAGSTGEVADAGHRHAAPANPVTAHEADTTSAHKLEYLTTDETDTALVPHPDGAGGVVWGPDEGTGVGGGGAYAETIGDGAETSFAIVHGLGTQDVIVELWDLSGADPVRATLDPDEITITDDDTVTVDFIAAPSADQYRVVVVSGGGGGSGSSGDLIGLTVYRPGSDVAVHSTSSTTSVDVDATNLAVTFTVPASGAVLVRFEALMAAPAPPGKAYWQVREGSTVVVESWADDTSNSIRKTVTIYVSGLTPGDVKTWKWGHRIGTGGGTAYVFAGPTYGDAIIEVRDADIADAPADGSVLAVHAYTPGSDDTLSTNAGAIVDVDATNAAITFVAPASGRVLVRASALCNPQGSASRWVIREGTTSKGEVYIGQHSTAIRCSAEWVVSGLTPGASLTYKLAHYGSGGSGSSIYAGPTFGALVLTVLAA